MKPLILVLVIAYVVLSACDEEANRTLLERQFDAHVAAAGLQRAKVTYAVSPVRESWPLQFSLLTSGTVGKFRVDSGFGDTIHIILDDGTNTLYCSNSVKAATDGSCTYKYAAFAGFMEFPLWSGVSSAGQAEVISESHEQILGATARCFQTLYEAWEVDYCYSADFRLLRSRWQLNDGMPSIYTAITVEGVRETDFEPPYPIVESD